MASMISKVDFSKSTKHVFLVLGHYAQGQYAQTEITPKEIELFKENSSDFFQVII